MEFKDKLIKLRKRYSISQTELAQQVGVSRKSIQFYESGERYPRKHTLESLAQVLKVSVDYLVSDREMFIVEAGEAEGLEGQQSAQRFLDHATALFAGGSLTDEDKDALMRTLQEIYWDSKGIKDPRKP